MTTRRSKDLSPRSSRQPSPDAAGDSAQAPLGARRTHRHVVAVVVRPPAASVPSGILQAVCRWIRHAGPMTTIDDTVRRAAIERLLRFDTDDTDHDLYHDDAVLEFPQSGERFEGLDNFREWRDQDPAEVTMRVRRISGSGDAWVGELRRRAVDARRQRARVPRRTYRQREDLRHRAMDCPEWRATAPPSAGGGPAESRTSRSA